MNVSSEVCLIQIEDKEKIITFYNLSILGQGRPTPARKWSFFVTDRQIFLPSDWAVVMIEFRAYGETTKKKF